MPPLNPYRTIPPRVIPVTQPKLSRKQILLSALTRLRYAGLAYLLAIIVYAGVAGWAFEYPHYPPARASGIAGYKELCNAYNCGNPEARTTPTGILNAPFQPFIPPPPEHQPSPAPPVEIPDRPLATRGPGFARDTASKILGTPVAFVAEHTPLGLRESAAVLGLALASGFFFKGTAIMLRRN